MNMNSLHDAMVNELKDLLSAEQQITKALPKMAKHANSPRLRSAFEEHLEQTNAQIERLEQVFKLLDEPSKSKKCEGIAGIIEEGEEMLKKDADPAVLDAMLIAAAQKVEHYEIASYGTVCAWASQMGHDDVCDLLNETLDEEKQTDVKLTELADNVNPDAASM